MPPTFANGKICYLEIPAIDIAQSAEFYKRPSDVTSGAAVTVAPSLTTRSAK